MKKQQPASLFGRRLRTARRDEDIPQDKLGVQIGLDEHTASARISRYETGVHEPPFEIALKLAKVLRVPAAYFYCEDEDLAEIVLAWSRISNSERKRLRQLVATMLPEGLIK
ncbi:helix-turn-helix transcriptional regulator [Cupriavidus taiwanensis]|uniref:XRE family transcriptional regulator n=1 Tax=Cupriavidus pauculus TaxID=82633 RepID=A0A3G8H1W2_9BURK|nr:MULTISPECIES: helix-turn-helix transcriptional regulator [Cupriavidus]AZG14511.1 XRE family transcriptional regulator [Cupriavidus pauculus]MBY4732203.1 helix-turn-helix domain-containing protein [Cupriavidus pauculus]MDK3024212.1 helix-turn-helix transcriptional regulator [Cupriavidus taiwanensis]